MAKIKQLYPVGDRALIRVIPSDKETKSGLLLAGIESGSRNVKGVVEALGDKTEKVKVGDTVYFYRYRQADSFGSSDDVKEVVKYDDIIAVER